MSITYHGNDELTSDEFVDLLHRSGLAERRPVDDRACIEGMLRHSNLIITARMDGKLVGVARSMTDFHYACYLSDLAVDRSHHSMGIGIELQRRTQDRLGPRCKLILLSAPAANGYYPRVGFSNNPNCWVIGRHERIGKAGK